MSEQQRTQAPDTIELVQPEWLDAWREYGEGLEEDTALDFGDRETLMIHQDGFAGGWTAASEHLTAELAQRTVERDEARVLAEQRLKSIGNYAGDWLDLFNAVIEFSDDDIDEDGDYIGEQIVRLAQKIGQQRDQARADLAASREWEKAWREAMLHRCAVVTLDRSCSECRKVLALLEGDALAAQPDRVPGGDQ